MVALVELIALIAIAELDELIFARINFSGLTILIKKINGIFIFRPFLSLQMTKLLVLLFFDVKSYFLVLLLLI